VTYTVLQKIKKEEGIKEENPLNLDSASERILTAMTVTHVCRERLSDPSKLWTSIHTFNSVMAAPSPPAFQEHVQSLTCYTSSFHCIIAINFSNQGKTLQANALISNAKENKVRIENATNSSL